MTKATARSIARRRQEAGKYGTTRRSTRSIAANRRPVAVASGGAIQSRTVSGGSANNSAMPTPFGLRARGRSAISTRSGTITVRDQYDTLVM